MVRAKNYETVSTFVKVMQINTAAFFPDSVYIGVYCIAEWHLNVTSFYNGSSVSVMWSQVSSAVNYTVYLCEIDPLTQTCQVTTKLDHFVFCLNLSFKLLF